MTTYFVDNQKKVTDYFFFFFGVWSNFNKLKTPDQWVSTILT